MRALLLEHLLGTALLDSLLNTASSAAAFIAAARSLTFLEHEEVGLRQTHGISVCFAALLAVLHYACR